MRAFPYLHLLIFLISYIILSYGTMRSLITVSEKKHKSTLKAATCIETVILMLLFVVLYIWPKVSQHSTSYTLPMLYNGLLVIDLMFKIPLFISFILSVTILKKYKKITSYTGLLLAIPVSLTIFTAIINAYKITINNPIIYSINLPVEFDGYKIAHISDFHLGSYPASKKTFANLQDELLKAQQNCLVFTGDLVNNYWEETLDWEKTIRQITQGIPAYSILGNHDYGNYSNWKNELQKSINFKKIVNAHQKFGFHLLQNETIILRSGKDSIFLIGVENWGHPPFPQYADFQKALEGIPTKGFNLLLTHDPAHWQYLCKNKEEIDLTLSGHTHGMQWGIKPAGIPFSISYLVSKTWGGMYQVGKNKLYVNTGTGNVGIPFRIDMPPELTIITLKRGKIN